MRFLFVLTNDRQEGYFRYAAASQYPIRRLFREGNPNMTETEVVRVLHEYFDSQFPKACTNCERIFATLSEYIQVTKRVGMPISYDANDNDWTTRKPIGTAVFSNCPCGTTLTLNTGGMPLSKRLELLNWVKLETRRRGLSPSELLEYLRDEIRRRVLGDRVQDP